MAIRSLNRTIMDMLSTLMMTGTHMRWNGPLIIFRGLLMVMKCAISAFMTLPLHIWINHRAYA